MAESVFLADPDCPTLVAKQASKTTTKVFGPHSPGVARYLFSLFFFIELNSLLTFLKDARERGAHEDCQSPLPGQVPGPVSQGRCAIMRTIRTRTNDELDGGSK